MLRLLVVIVSLGLVAAFPVLAQQMQQHALSAPDTLNEDPSVYRVKMPANYKIAPHFHKAAENVTVLAGSFFVGMGQTFDQGSGKELPVGGFASIPATHPHFAWAGSQETIVQVHGTGPTDITFVNPADDPRKK